MKMEQTTENINDLTDDILKNLKKFKRNKHPKYIHRLRIDIKKLWAASSFINETHKRTLYPEKAFKKLFNKAGNLRQWQLNIKLLKSYPKHDHQVEDLENLGLDEKFILHTSEYKKDVNDLSGRYQTSFDLPKIKKIKKYFEHQINKSKKLLLEQKTPNYLHLFRKRLKKLLYAYEFLPLQAQNEITIDTEYLNRLQIQIGIWHDLTQTIKYFEQIQFPLGEYENLKSKENEEYQGLMKSCGQFIADFNF